MRRLIAVAVALLATLTLAGCDWPDGDDRNFTGTITEAAFVSGYVSVQIKIDGEEDAQTHILADVYVRDYKNNCGAWKSDSIYGDPWIDMVGDKQVQKTVDRLLPAGTEVDGYMALAEDEFVLGDAQEIIKGDRTKEEALSYLHTDGMDSLSVNAQIVATGWAESGYTGVLELEDPIVQREHDAVIAVEKRKKRAPAEVICGNREREDDERREERKHRRHLAAIAAAAKDKQDHEETMRDYYAHNDENGYHILPGEPGYVAPGSGGSGGSGARCYNSGGNTYSAC